MEQKYKGLTYMQFHKMLHLYRTGWSINKIAAEFQCSTTFIMHQLEKFIE